MALSAALLMAGAGQALAMSGGPAECGLAAGAGGAVAGPSRQLTTQGSEAKVGASGIYAKLYEPVSGASASQLRSWGYWYKPNYVVKIKSFKKNVLRFAIGYTGANATPVYTSDSISCTVKNGKASFKYADSWSNKGKGTIKLGKGFVKVKAAQTSAARSNRGTLATGGRYITLKKMSKGSYDKAVTV